MSSDLLSWQIVHYAHKAWKSQNAVYDNILCSIIAPPSDEVNSKNTEDVCTLPPPVQLILCLSQLRLGVMHLCDRMNQECEKLEQRERPSKGSKKAKTLPSSTLSVGQKWLTLSEENVQQVITQTLPNLRRSLHQITELLPEPVLRHIRNRLDDLEFISKKKEDKHEVDHKIEEFVRVTLPLLYYLANYVQQVIFRASYEILKREKSEVVFEEMFLHQPASVSLDAMLNAHVTLDWDVSYPYLQSKRIENYAEGLKTSGLHL